MNKKEKNIIEFFNKNDQYQPNFENIKDKINYSYIFKKKKKNRLLFLSFFSTTLACIAITIFVLVFTSQDLKKKPDSSLAVFNSSNEEASNKAETSELITELPEFSQSQNTEEIFESGSARTIIYNNHDYFLQPLKDFDLLNEMEEIDKLDVDTIGEIIIYSYFEELYGYNAKNKQWFKFILK